MRLEEALAEWDMDDSVHLLHKQSIPDYVEPLVAAARSVVEGTEIRWCEVHSSVDVDGYCEAFHADAETGRWDPKDYDDVIARRFGKCVMVTRILVEPIDAPLTDRIDQELTAQQGSKKRTQAVLDRIGEIRKELRWWSR